MNKYNLSESNIDWIGQVPKHWKRDKLFRLCNKMGSGGTPRSTNEEFYGGDIPWIQSGDLNDSYVVKTEKQITEEALQNSSAKIFPKGTLLVAMYGATIGKLGIMEMDAATNQACCALQLSKKLNIKYAYYLMLDIRDYLITQSYGGGQPNISQEVLKQQYLFYGSLKEQETIAKHLDKICLQIDKVISVKKKQLENLDMFYNSRLHEVITKGLKHEVKLVESGVPWQGKVPNTWSREKLFRLSNKMGSGGTPKSTNEEYYDGEIPWIQSGDLNDGIITTTKKCINERAILESSAKLFPKETVLIAMYGATIGKLGIMEMEAATNQACCAVQIGPKLISEFVFFMFFDMRKYLISLGYGGGQPNISQEILKQQYFYFPSLTEQEQIVEYIKRIRSKTNALRNKVEEQIKVLENYRKSLIHECVTGKKQVTDIVVEKEIKRALA